MAPAVARDDSWGESRTAAWEDEQPATSRMRGASVYQVSNGRFIVPLLDPDTDGIPFALGVELLCYPGRESCCGNRGAPTRGHDECYELHFIMEGTAELCDSGPENQVIKQLRPGDSLLIPPGAARHFVSLAEPQGSPAAAEPRSGDCKDSFQGDVFGMASLVLLMPEVLEDDEDRAREVAGAAARHWRQGEHVGQLPMETVERILSHRMAGRLAQLRRAPKAAEADRAAGLGFDSPLALVGRLFTVVPDWLGLGRVAEVRRDGALEPVKGDSGGSREARSPPRSPSPGPMVDFSHDVRVRTLTELQAYHFPNQTNRLSLAFDPLADDEASRTPFTFGVEAFDPGHLTPPHVHDTAHELFFILAGSGEGFCNGRRFPVAAGDAVVFRPGSMHGIDVDPDDGMYCLELMIPNASFAELVRSGKWAGKLKPEDLCILISVGCGAPGHVN